MSKGKIRRPGSGRTKGSFSFVKITVADIMAKLADHSTPVIVSRKWAEQLGFQGVTAAPAGKTIDSIQGETPESKANVKLTEFE